jgi:hypothetical protein
MAWSAAATHACRPSPSHASSRAGRVSMRVRAPRMRHAPRECAGLRVPRAPSQSSVPHTSRAAIHAPFMPAQRRAPHAPHAPNPPRVPRPRAPVHFPHPRRHRTCAAGGAPSGRHHATCIARRDHVAGNALRASRYARRVTCIPSAGDQAFRLCGPARGYVTGPRRADTWPSVGRGAGASSARMARMECAAQGVMERAARCS